MRLKEALTYDDVLLVPKYSDIQSRKEIDVGNFLDDNIHLELPVISSPMDTVTESDMSIAMHKAGGLGIVHRYNTPAEQVLIINQIQQNTNFALLAASVGVTGDFETRAGALFDAGVNIICIDVAHGHHILMKNALETLRNIFGNAVHLMAGNVATKQGYEDLADWGADSVRCNVGGGSICSTRVQTGHGVPGLQTILDCSRSDREARIIADGGLKNSGDMVKAFAAGADLVMVGSLLAGTKESPGFIVEERDGSKHKLYRGMASKEAQMDWRGEYSSNEGVSTRIPYKGSVADVLRDIKNGLASGFSYSGARNVKQLWTGAEWLRQTSAGLTESRTHILERY
jgi:IMP dehydrogenase